MRLGRGASRDALREPHGFFFQAAFSFVERCQTRLLIVLFSLLAVLWPPNAQGQPEAETLFVACAWLPGLKWTLLECRT